ncbi:hypothetical protein KD146_13445 [Devosia sp. BSSL-BM10]|uniref:Uncharacterized protein n=1 Tax=Devosia litorisediminis TaxID=2829817 RepID=A0A942E7J5_9HYPH|nr:hypothetical protein [Devosia litorisediminis]MBS3849703.1 hypothetical protein [Devosia litorisediminis]
MTLPTPESVFRKYVTAGVPDSGKHEPIKDEIVQLLNSLFGTSRGGWVVARTKAELAGITPVAETDGGVVLADPDPTLNGYYDRDATAWVRGRGFPDTMGTLTGIGGTANAITASVEVGVNPSDVDVVFLPAPPGTNAAGPVTIAISGTVYPLKSASGSDPAAGDIIEGVGTMLFRSGGEWRQLFSSATGATFDHQGDYAGVTTYTAGQVVTGSDGKWYQLKDASASGDDPVGSVTGAWLEVLAAASVADGAVTTVKIADGAVTEPKHATGGVSSRALAASAATLEKIADDAKADFRLVDPNGPRTPIGYFGTYTVQILGQSSFAMGGFRYKGRYLERRAPVFSSPAFDALYAPGGHRHIVSYGNGTTTQDDLGVETLHVKEQWYAVFACANDGDANAVFKVMPFFRVRDVGVGGANVVRFCPGGENTNGSTASKVYTMPVDGLAGVDCLIIHETLNGRPNGFSGRVTTITDNTTSSATLANVGGLANSDYILPAPPGYQHYRYIGALYNDTAELRNIADTGTIVHSRGSTNTRNTNGVVNGVAGTGLDIPCGGYISPLSTGVLVHMTETLSTSEVGWVYDTWGMDANHDSINLSWYKPTAAAASMELHGGILPFSFSPWANLRVNGTLNVAAMTRSMRMYGWLEP